MPCHNDQFTEADIPDLTGYVVIVTGGIHAFPHLRSIYVFSFFPNDIANDKTPQETAASVSKQPSN